MNDNAASIRGTVIRVPGDQPGLIVADGRQWSFQISGVWRSPVAPALNQSVEIEIDATGAIASIAVVDTAQQATEKLKQAAGAVAEWAQESGREKLVQARRGVDAAKSWAMSYPTIAKNPKAWAIGGAVVLVLLLAWTFGGGGPSSGQIRGALQAEFDGQIERAKQFAGRSTSENMLPKLYDVRKIGCEKAGGTEAYVCDVEVDVSMPFGGRHKGTRKFRFVRDGSAWKLSSDFGL